MLHRAFFQMMDKPLGRALLMSEDMRSAPVVYGLLWLENCFLPKTNNSFQNCFAANAD